MAVNDAIARLQSLLGDVSSDLENYPDDKYDLGYRNAIQQALHIINAEA